jgi:hypothetical protein
MTEDKRASQTVTFGALDPEIRIAMSTTASKHQLPPDFADATACCVTTQERPASLFGKLFFGNTGFRTWAIVLTPKALVWAMKDGKKIVVSGGFIRDIRLEPNVMIDDYGEGLMVHGHLFNGPPQAGSMFVVLGPGGDSDAFRALVEKALAKS